jgi:hypothetical protein
MIRIGGYLIDAATSEEESLEADVTEYPVESGAVISDHVRNKPRTLELEFTVSDTPIGEAEAARAAGVVPSSEARQTLEDLRATRKPFTVVTARRTYENMVFASMRFPRDGQTGDALKATATLQQIEIVDVRRLSKLSLGQRSARGVSGAAVAWLCPIGVAVAKSTAENRRHGCRTVVTRDLVVEGIAFPALAYGDGAGELLTQQDIGRFESQKISTGLGIRDPIVDSHWDETQRRWVLNSGAPVAKTPTRNSTFRLMTGVDEDYQAPAPPDRPDRGNRV